jgi:hypothetical protein
MILENIDDMDCPHPKDICPAQYTAGRISPNCRACKKQARQDEYTEAMRMLKIKIASRVKEKT